MERKKRRMAAGFTLVELMVVVVIIAILAGVVVANYSGSAEKAYESRIKVDFKVIEDSIIRFKLDTSRYPETLEELMIGEGIDGYRGPYLRKPPMDPWEIPYLYELTGEEPFAYELKSLGADGAEGGEGDNKDYSNMDAFEDTGYGQ
jgi:general secretion pathway protein G